MPRGKAILDSHVDLFSKRAFGFLATIMPDGSPQVTPVWVDFDGTDVLLNSTKGQQKDLNMRSRLQVALCVVDPANPYRYMAIRGRIVDVIEDGAVDHIHALAAKYTGAEKYGFLQDGDVRVMYRLHPEEVHGADPSPWVLEQLGVHA
jgi:PPOX class probable F420-dependent enzyme